MRKVQNGLIISFIFSFIAYAMFLTLLVSSNNFFVLIPTAFKNIYSRLISWSFNEFLYDLFMFVALFGAIFLIIWIIKLIRRLGSWQDVLGIVVFVVTILNLLAVLVYRADFVGWLNSTDNLEKLTGVYTVSLMAVVSIIGLLVCFNGITIRRKEKVKIRPQLNEADLDAIEHLLDKHFAVQSQESVKSMPTAVAPVENEPVVDEKVLEEVRQEDEAKEIPPTEEEAFAIAEAEDIRENETERKEEKEDEEDANIEETKIVPEQPTVEDMQIPKIVQVPFKERIMKLPPEEWAHYQEMHDYLSAYGFHSRMTNSGETFSHQRKIYAKIALGGKTLKLYMALDPHDYDQGPIPVKDSSATKAYVEIPTLLKVKSKLAIKRACILIDDLAKAAGLAIPQK